MTSLLTIIGQLLVPKAHALGEVTVFCGGLIGCGAQGEALTGALTAILYLAVTLAACLSTAFFIYGGLQMVMPWSEGSAEAGKKTIKNSLIGLAITMLSGMMVDLAISANVSGPNSNPLVAVMQWAIGAMLTIFNSLFFIAVVYAGIQMVMDQGKGEGYNKGIEILKWAITGAIIVNLSRAILDAFIHFVT